MEASLLFWVWDRDVDGRERQTRQCTESACLLENNSSQNLHLCFALPVVVVDNSVEESCRTFDFVFGVVVVVVVVAGLVPVSS